MIIVGIDPGPTESAMVMWYPHKGIESSRMLNNEDLLSGMHDATYAFHERGIEVQVYIEMIESYGMAVGKSTFETVFWIGRFFEVATEYAGALRIYRSQVKLNLCNSKKAKDSNIRQALIDRFGPPGTKKNPGYTYGLKRDLWQAFAVAVTAYDLYLKEGK